MLTYLWWFLFLTLVRDVVARYILDLGSEEDEVMQYLGYLVAIPLVLGSFAMRKVVTNVRSCRRLLKSTIMLVVL